MGQFIRIGKEVVSTARSPEQLARLRLVRRCFQPSEQEMVLSASVISGDESDGDGPITAQMALQLYEDVVVSKELSVEQAQQVSQ